MASSDLTIRILAQNLAKAALGELDGQLGGLDTRFRNVATGAGVFGGALTAGVTAPMAALAKQALDTAMDYESSMNMFQAVSGATAEQMAAVGQLAKQLGADMSLPATSAGDAGKAMTELAKAGLSVEDSMNAAKGALQLAAAGAISEAEAAKITAAALNAFHLEGSKATQVADMLAAAANASAADVQDLGQGFQQAAFAFSATKQPVEHLVTSLAALTNVGLTGSDAGTALKNAMVRLIDPTEEAKKAMRRFGIEVYDATGTLKPLPEIIEVFADATADLADQEKNALLSTVFLSDGMKAMIPLLDLGREGFENLETTITKQGAAADLAGARMQGLGGALQGLQSQIETLLLQTAEPFLGVLEGIVRAVAEIVPKIGELDPNLRNAALAFGAVLAAAGPLITVVAGVAAGFSLLSPPVLAVVAAFGAASAAAAVLAAAFAGDFLGLRTQVIPALGEIKDAVAEAFGHIAETFETMSFGDALKTLTVELLTWVAETQVKLNQALLSWGKAFVEWVWSVPGDLFAALGDLLSSLGSWIDESGPEIEQNLEVWIDAFVDWVIEAVPGLFQALGSLLTKVADWISGTATNEIEQEIDANWVPAFLGWVADLVPKIALRFLDIEAKILELIAHAAGRFAQRILDDWVPAFLDWAGDLKDRIGQKLGEVTSAITSWISETASGIGEQAKGIGLAIIQGIASGLIPTELFKKAGDIARGAVESMAQAIQSHSPSKLAQQLVGEPIVQGIIVGLIAEVPELEQQAEEVGTSALRAVVDGARAGMHLLADLFGGLPAVAIAAFDEATQGGAIFFEVGEEAVGEIAAGAEAAAPQISVAMQAAAVKASYEAAMGFGGEGGAAVVAAATKVGQDAADGFKKGTDAMVASAQGAMQQISSIWAQTPNTGFWNAIPQPGSGGSFTGNQPGQGTPQEPTVTPSPGMPPAVQIPNSGGFFGTPGFGGFNPQPIDLGLSDFLTAAYSALVTTVQAQNPGMVLMWGQAAQEAFDAAARAYYGANAGLGDASSLAQGFANAFNNAPWLQLVPAFANGGIVTQPTFGLVGEAGPEAIIPLSRLRGGSETGAREVHIHVHTHGPVYGVLDLERKIVASVKDAAASGAFRGVLAPA